MGKRKFTHLISLKSNVITTNTTKSTTVLIYGDYLILLSGFYNLFSIK